jgi:hypothetical protein
MVIAQKWVVCEQSGRWAAALRATFARLAKTRPSPRLYEVRSFDELSPYSDASGCDLTLIEIGPANFAETLHWLTQRGSRCDQFVALLKTDSRGGDPIAEMVWEIGAAEVVESPRQLTGLLALYKRLLAARHPIKGSWAERPLFADWAWATLPWQEA